MDMNDKGVQTQIRNIEASTGKAFPELRALIEAWGPLKYAQRRERIAQTFSLSLAHADTLGACVDEIQRTEQRAAAGSTWKEESEAWFSGPKAKFLPLFQELAREVQSWPGVEFSPKKGYLSLRTKKQFATLGPVTGTRLEVGLNGKHFVAGDRLIQLPAGQICHYQVRLSEGDQVDTQLLDWIRSAYEAAA